jgi:hypothetical protein
VVNFLDRFPDFFGRKERALYRIARQSNSVNQTRWQQALIAARKAESLPSTVSASYNVRNRTSMTQSRSIVAFSK